MSKTGFYDLFLKGLKSVFNFILIFHVQIILICMIIFLLSSKSKHEKIYYFDTDFIRTKFALHLAENGRLNETQIRDALASLEKKINHITASFNLGGGTLLKKSAIISGGTDITVHICEELEFINCNAYE